MKLYIYERAGVINLTSLDFGYNNAYVLDYDFDSYGSGLNSFVVEYIADGELKQAGVLYEIQWNGKYQPLYYRELEFSYSSGRYETLYEITDMDVYGYSFESMVDDIVYAKSNHWYLVSGNDTIYGNSYGGLFDTGIGDDVIYGYGGNDLIWIGAGNDIAYGGTGNDAFYTTSAASYFGGVNYVYGESGTDSLIISSSQAVFRSVDVWGDRGFTKGTEYLFIQDNNGGYLYATGIERIQILNGERGTVDNWNYYLSDVVFRPGYNLSDKNYTSNNTNYTIDLGEYISTINYGDTTKYEFELSNSSYNDQFSLSGDILRINNGSGSTKTIDITITASTVSSDGIVRPGQSPAKKTFSVTFKDNDSSISSASGTSGNDTRTLTSGNDTWQVGLGTDKINGGSGSDTLLIPFGGTTAQGTYITKGLDVKGSYTGIINQTFIYIYNEDQGGTTAWNFEKIRFNDLSRNISTFEDTGRWDVQSTRIPDKTVSNNSTSNINLNDYFWSINAATTNITYTIQSSNNVNLEDQIILSGSNLRLESGSQGDMQTIQITIRGKQNFSDDWSFSSDDYNYNDETFTVTMRDNNVSGTSGDDTITLTSNNDTYTATFGVDRIDGGAGTDTIIVPDDARITRSTDVKGWSNRTGIKGKDFLYIELKDDEGEYSGSTVAWNFEKIQYGGETTAISSFNDNGSWYIDSSNINDKVLGNFSNQNINLDDFYWTKNEGATLSYTISVSGNELKDQITLNGSTINIKAGSSGNNFTATVTVKATQSGANWNTIDSKFESDEQAFTVTMKDDDADPLEGTNIIVPDGSSRSLSEWSKGYYDAEQGDDIYILSNAIQDNTNFKISDTLGSNTIQFVDGFSFISSKFSSNSLELTLTNSRKITIDNADLFTYEIGGNETSGTTGKSLNYSQFSSNLGVSTLPTNSSFVDGEAATISGTSLSINTTSSNYKFSNSKNEYGPSLNEYSSTAGDSGTQNYTSSNDIIVLTGQSSTLRGNDGDDIYFLSNLLPNNSKTEIVDQTGNNIIQIPDNTLIKEVIFASDAVRITFDNNKVVTVNDATNFTFELSGNVSSGDTPVQFSYSEFAELFDVSSPITSNITKSGNYYTKSDASNLSNNIVDINESSTTTINGASSSEEFRYEFSIVNEKALSNEGNYEITIDNFDVNDDKIVFVNKNGNNLSLSQFKTLSGLEISGNSFDNRTGFYFTPDATGSSGTLIINNIYDSDLEEINVEILSEDNLVNAINNTAGYELSSSINSSKSTLESFNISALSGTIDSSEYDEIIILSGGAKTYKGNEGDDTYFISNLLPKNSKSDIVDQVGNNIIQFPDNTFIDSILFTKDAIRVTLDDNREITINDADDFFYNLGGNSLEGDPGQNLSFVELASVFGIDDVISLSSSELGTSDIYII